MLMDNMKAFEILGLEPQNGKLTTEQIAKVKGLGCLKDKRYDNIFNVRVITRNGKITADEQRAIAEAAERFGSGEVSMTVRLTIEIQGVPYDKIPETILFLKRKRLGDRRNGRKGSPGSFL